MASAVYLEKFLLIRGFDHTQKSHKKQLLELIRVVDAAKSSLNDTFPYQYVIAKFISARDCDNARRTLNASVLDGAIQPLIVQSITRDQLSVHNHFFGPNGAKKAQKASFSKLLRFFACSANNAPEENILQKLLAAEHKPEIQSGNQLFNQHRQYHSDGEIVQMASAVVPDPEPRHRRQDSRYGERTIRRVYSHGIAAEEKYDEMDFRLIRALSLEEQQNSNDVLMAQHLQDEEYAQYLQGQELQSVSSGDLVHSNSSSSNRSSSHFERIRHLQDVVLTSAAVAAPARHMRMSHYSQSARNVVNRESSNSRGRRNYNNGASALEYLNAFTVTDTKMTTESCTICMDDYQLGDKVVPLSCLHRFHKKCVGKWLENHHVCPLCRAPALA